MLAGQVLPWHTCMHALQYDPCCTMVQHHGTAPWYNTMYTKAASALCLTKAGCASPSITKAGCVSPSMTRPAIIKHSAEAALPEATPPMTLIFEQGRLGALLLAFWPHTCMLLYLPGHTHTCCYTSLATHMASLATHTHAATTPCPDTLCLSSSPYNQRWDYGVTGEFAPQS